MFPCVFSPPFKYSISPLIPCVPFLLLSTHACLVFLLPFLLRSLFFLSYFLEPWWCRSGEAQLGLRHWGEADTNYEGKERKQKKVLKLSRIYQLWHPLPYYYYFFCLHGCHGLTDFCPRHYLNWRSWIWFLETHQSLESVDQLRQIIVKKKNKKKTTPKCLTKGSKMQTLGSTRCGSHVSLSDWNKWTTNRRLEQKCMDGEV